MNRIMTNTIRMIPTDISDKLYIGFSWFEEEVRIDKPIVHDIILCALILNNEGLVDREEDFVFYNNCEDPAHVISYNDDISYNSLVDDSIIITLKNVKASTKQIQVFAYIYDATCRQQCFAQLHHFHMFTSFGPWRIEPFLFKNLPAAEIMNLCEFIKEDNSWLFRPIGTGAKGDSSSYVRSFLSSVNI